MTFTMSPIVEMSEDSTPLFRFTLTPKEPGSKPKTPSQSGSTSSSASRGAVRRRRSLSSASTSSISPVASTSRASTGSLVSDAEGSPEPYSMPFPREEYVLAMHDFAPQVENATCLTFRAGQVIHVLNHDDSGWWDGELDGRRGWFPSNYVQADISPASIMQEQLPRSRRHMRGSSSIGSTASWASAVVPQRERFGERHRPSALSITSDSMTRSSSGSSSASSNNAYCPPIMVPLLQALSLLQAAVRSTKPTHFQPSTAYIISCVRGLLQESNCLERDAILLQEYPVLARERKGVLEDLAALVNQAKKASEYAEEVEREEEEMPDAAVDAMLRMGGQVFAHVRRFIAIAVQCGIDLPGGSSRRLSEESLTTSNGYTTAGRLSRESMRRISVAGPEVDMILEDEEETFRGPLVRNVAATASRTPRAARTRAAPGTPSRTKSLGDLRKSRRANLPASESDVPLLPTQSNGHAAMKTARYAPDTSRLHGRGSSQGHSSESSTSSISSTGSSYVSPPPVRPPFPSGPSSAAQVLSAIKSLHDTYLSTIAAFIGHVHSHSRTSHAAATGHLYDLVREIVEVVCRILCLTDAVLAHPGVPRVRMRAVREGKQALYDVTSALADLVRVITTKSEDDDDDDSMASSEEQEKNELLRTATNALKIGSECVHSVQACLHRTVGNAPFVVQLQFNDDEVEPVWVGDETRLDFDEQDAEPLSRSESFADLHAQALRSGEEIPPVPTLPSSVFAESGSKRAIQEDSSSEFGSRAPDAQSFSSHASFSTSSSVAVDAPSHGGRRHDGRPRLSLRLAPAIEESTAESNSASSAVSFSSRDGTEEAATSPTSHADDTDVTLTTWEAPGHRHRDSRSIPLSADKELPSVPLPTIAEVPSVPIEQQFSTEYNEEDLALNSEKLIVGATLPAIVEKMTPHDAKPEPVFSAVFWLTFRLFSTPAELLNLLIARYNIMPPVMSQEEKFVWQQQKGMPTRLRVFNFIKSWLEIYWKPEDDVVLPSLQDFVENALKAVSPGPSQRVLEIIRLRRQGQEINSLFPGGRIPDAGMPINPPRPVALSDIPRPILNKTLFAALRNKNYSAVIVTDFDALELARQLTCWECRLYSALPAEEVLNTGQEGAPPALHVKAITTLSTLITGWVTEHILNEQDTKKRTILMKFFIKLADRCNSLHNYSSSRSILAALDSSTISRLHQTWAGLPQKTRAQLDALRKLADHARNYYEYRSRLRNTVPPAVPFLGLYLTDITFCREGNPSHRASPLNPDKKLINFNKYHKLARIVQDMQRFQTPYSLKEIPEVQEYLKAVLEKSHHGNIHDLYRRSLLVEPRTVADVTPTPTNEMKQFFSWSRSNKDVSAGAS